MKFVCQVYSTKGDPKGPIKALTNHKHYCLNEEEEKRVQGIVRFSETWRSLKPDNCNVGGRPVQQPSSECQFAEESDCLATEINPDTLVPQPIGTCKRMGGRKVLGLTCDLQMRKMSSTI